MTVSLDFLQEKARKIRLQTIQMLAKAGSGHPGGSLSEIEILVSLYYSKMRLGSGATDPDRDRFVLSNGHANPPLYAILADKGYFPEDELWTLRRLGSHLQGHPDMNKTAGIDCSTGSLGQGVSMAAGMALGLKYQHKDCHVYALTGDGELQEGIVWEAAMAAAHYKLDNLTLIVDRNGLQIDGTTEDVMALGDLAAKFRAFGFYVKEIDGNDFTQVLSALDTHEKDKPVCIIAKTVKGKGVSFMENQVGWHGKVPSGEQLTQALEELEGRNNG